MLGTMLASVAVTSIAERGKVMDPKLIGLAFAATLIVCLANSYVGLIVPAATTSTAS